MRNITPEIFADEFFGSLSATHRLLWLGLVVNIADDQGRMIDNVALMRSLLFPYDNNVTARDIEKGLMLFTAKHKIVRYAVGTNGSSKKLIQITNWWRYQKSMQWAGRSQYPAPEKWTDRIRMHTAGNVIVTEGWSTQGGYLAPTKRLPSRKVAPTKRLPFSEVNINVNDLVVVVGDAIKLYEEKIGHPTKHVIGEIERMFKISPVNLSKAISITADQGKTNTAYLKGVFKNLMDGTKKPEYPIRGGMKPAQKKIDSGKYQKL